MRREECPTWVLKKALYAVLRSSGVPVQFNAEVGSWTTYSRALRRVGERIPTGYFSIPRRYTHSSSEVMDLRDAFGAFKLLKEFISSTPRLDLEFISRQKL
ncbi:MAG: hypothetical protein ACLFN0_05195 [Thermovirgaceae bacterium]